jgi:hypothetical protein
VDQDLESAYRELLTTYDVRYSSTLEKIKTILIQNFEQTFRPDAALCLLSLYDDMILAPYSKRLRSGPLISDSPSPLTEQDLEKRTLDSFWLLVRTIERDKKDLRATSHDVVKTINSIWGSLSSFFNWG